MEFKPFPKIPRLNRSITITEKLDGTNASILIPEEPELPIFVGSRNRWITPEKDNYGFAAWVRANEAELRQGLGAGHHFGEWYGSGIQRRYGLQEKRFALFNTARWANGAPPLCTVVPVLYTGSWDQGVIDATVTTLKSQGSVAVPGFANPEGVVVFHAASGRMFKVLCENDHLHKGEVAA